MLRASAAASARLPEPSRWLTGASLLSAACLTLTVADTVAGAYANPVSGALLGVSGVLLLVLLTHRSLAPGTVPMWIVVVPALLLATPLRGTGILGGVCSTWRWPWGQIHGPAGAGSALPWSPSRRRDIGRGGDPGRCRVVPAVLRLGQAGPVPPRHPVGTAILSRSAGHAFPQCPAHPRGPSSSSAVGGRARSGVRRAGSVERVLPSPVHSKPDE
jgi:hypothetical protein